MHFSGSVVNKPSGEEIACFSDKKPYKHLHSMIKLQTENTKKNAVQTIYRDDDVLTWVYGMDNGQSVFVGKGRIIRPFQISIIELNVQMDQRLYLHMSLRVHQKNKFRHTKRYSLSNREGYI